MRTWIMILFQRKKSRQKHQHKNLDLISIKIKQKVLIENTTIRKMKKRIQNNKNFKMIYLMMKINEFNLYLLFNDLFVRPFEFRTFLNL